MIHMEGELEGPYLQACLGATEDVLQKMNAIVKVKDALDGRKDFPLWCEAIHLILHQI